MKTCWLLIGLCIFLGFVFYYRLRKEQFEPRDGAPRGGGRPSGGAPMGGAPMGGGSHPMWSGPRPGPPGPRPPPPGPHPRPGPPGRGPGPWPPRYINGSSSGSWWGWSPLWVWDWWPTSDCRLVGCPYGYKCVTDMYGVSTCIKNTD